MFRNSKPMEIRFNREPKKRGRPKGSENKNKKEKP